MASRESELDLRLQSQEIIGDRVERDNVDDVDSEDDRNANQEAYYWQMKLQV